MSKLHSLADYAHWFLSLGGRNKWIPKEPFIKSVKVSKCADVLTPEQIHKIKEFVRPKERQCYKNATLVSALLGFEYCEGYVHSIIPIEHAFNKVGDKYIDVTLEFALGEDVTALEYVTIGEYDCEHTLRVTSETGCFGGVFQYTNYKVKKVC